MTQKTAQTELKPCPFCGCEHIQLWPVKHEDGVVLFTIRCQACHEGMDGFVDKFRMISKWNSRATDTLTAQRDEMLEALRRAESHFRMLPRSMDAPGSVMDQIANIISKADSQKVE